MRRRLLTLTAGLLLSLTCAWGQALDLAKQMPVNNAKDPQASMAESMRLLGELSKLGADGVKQLGAALGTADEAKAYFALNGLMNYAMRPGADAERAAVEDGLIDQIKAKTDADQRNRLIQLLQYLATDKSVPVIAPLLANDDANDYAVRLLASLATPAARAALVAGQAGLKGRPLANVVRALGELGVKEANAAILPLAGSDDAVVKAAALYALSALGDAASRDALAKAAEATGKLERRANTALYLRWAAKAGEAGATAARELAKARATEPATVVDATLTVVAALGDKALPELMAALDTDNQQVRDGLLTSSLAIPGAPLTDALIAKLAGAKPELKAAILRTLGRRNAPQAADALRAALNDDNEAVRTAAVEAASHLMPAGPGILLTAMGGDRPDLIAAAGTALARLGNESVVRALVMTIRSAGNTAQARRYLGRLGQAGGGAAWRVLGIFVADPILGPDAAAAVASALTPKPNTKAPLTADNRKVAEAAANVATDPAVKAKLAALVGTSGGPGRDTNLALNKPVFESDDHEADQVPENAVDGRFDDPAVGWWTPKPATITVNLQNVYRIDRVKVYTYWVDGRSYQYTVEVSMDNKTWSLVADRSKNTDASTDKGDEITFPATDAKFVRLNMLHNSANASMHVVEFMVFPVGGSAAAAGAPGKSLAEGKPVTGEPAAEADNTPERAVDGIADDTNQGFWASGTPATLTVDLQAPAKIDTTQVWFYWGGPRSYQWKVETSLDGKEWTLAADRTANTEESTDKGFVDKFKTVEARYVRLVVTKNSANPSAHIVEFKVFAEGTGPKVAAAAAPVEIVQLPAPKPDADGFQALLYAKDLAASGWTGSTKGYELDDNGVLTCIPGKGGNLLSAKEYGDFDFKFEFQLTPGANNGVGIRAPASGDAAYVGMEIQILDDRDPKYKDIKEWQAHGSIYGICPAKRDLLKPVGEWNTEEIIAQGTKIKVIVNGQVAVDFALATVTDAELLKSHPGVKNAKGRIGFLGHGDKVMFRNLKIKEL